MNYEILLLFWDFGRNPCPEPLLIKSFKMCIWSDLNSTMTHRRSNRVINFQNSHLIRVFKNHSTISLLFYSIIYVSIPVKTSKMYSESTLSLSRHLRIDINLKPFLKLGRVLPELSSRWGRIWNFSQSINFSICDSSRIWTTIYPSGIPVLF